ncbi:bifunctional Protein kinase domain/Protein kinase-like domain superfamily/Serine-threonine-protein kinase [Babesia duncani]|uniref:Bifunctional Protein kinase domain/Protein kinase-like domain superfamily/Serine-threonine-protein kinase n=1 Tax=Babesia duncani TaxID=323732 RepID=A0AAD9PMZ5_9APIC|nr:bifunctional Protein kinase domain/Protein kinase-like domain superfamily/Serine-threonine-protein kinase [Babesia duncani]
MDRLAGVNVWVTESCNYWRPVYALLPNPDNGKEFSISDSSITHENIHVGYALNQYLFQYKIAQTNHATLWLCFDIIDNEFYCIKTYYIEASRRERGIRFSKDNMDIVTMLDKVIDEIIYHCSLQKYPGVARVKEIIVNIENAMIYIVMLYYPSQLMHYDYNKGCYCWPTSMTDIEKTSGKEMQDCVFLYKEDTAKKIMRQIVETISALHSEGIIHKDIKPENILLTRVDEDMFESVALVVKPEKHDCDYTMPYVENRRQPLKPLKNNELESIIKLLKNENRCPGSRKCLYEQLKLQQYKLSSAFPYDPFMSSDFDWCIWEDAYFVCDSESKGSEALVFNIIGQNAYTYAVTLVDKIKANRVHIMEYFFNHKLKIPYTVNPNFKTPPNSSICVKEYNQHDKNQLVVLTDFGVASIGEPNEKNPDKLLIYDSEGTLLFNSPESLQFVEGGIQGEARDVFSLGITLYCMIYGILPFVGKSCIQVLISMMEDPLQFPEYHQVSDELKTLIFSMLHKDPNQRITLKQIEKHSWLI